MGENGSMRESKLLKKIYGHAKAMRTDNTTVMVGKLLRKAVLS